jgi:hypothetical protein
LVVRLTQPVYDPTDKGGTMNASKLIPVLLVFPLAVTSMACPTRPADSDSSGGHGGSSEMDAGSGGAKATGGTAGSSAGGSGNGGAAALGGSGPGGGTGGVAGTTGAGGVAGTTGTGGIGGGTGGAGTGGLPGTGGTAGGLGTGGSAETCNPSCDTITQSCVGTKCLLDDGQTCSVASQCASNTCTPFYLDQDGDTYGSGAAVGFCGKVAPVGYAAQNGDCCDDPAHLSVAKLIHPGAGYQTNEAGICGITWDYDCNGAIETNVSTCTACGAAPTCDCADESHVDPSECGMAVGATSCGTTGTGGCISVSHGAGTLGCK